MANEKYFCLVLSPYIGRSETFYVEKDGNGEIRGVTDPNKALDTMSFIRGRICPAGNILLVMFKEYIEFESARYTYHVNDNSVVGAFAKGYRQGREAARYRVINIDNNKEVGGSALIGMVDDGSACDVRITSIVPYTARQCRGIIYNEFATLPDRRKKIVNDYESYTAQGGDRIERIFYPNGRGR